MGGVLYINNDMVVSFSGDGKLTDEKNVPVIGATVTVTLYEKGTANQVSGVTWPVAFTDDGDGEYTAVLDDSANINSGTKYDMEIKADLNGAKGEWKETVTAAIRPFSR